MRLLQHPHAEAWHHAPPPHERTLQAAMRWARPAHSAPPPPLLPPEVALDARHLHGLDHHAGEAEGHLLRELLAVHAGLKAVPKVDVQQLACAGRAGRGGGGRRVCSCLCGVCWAAEPPRSPRPAHQSSGPASGLTGGGRPGPGCTPPGPGGEGDKPGSRVGRGKAVLRSQRQRCASSAPLPAAGGPWLAGGRAHRPHHAHDRRAARVVGAALQPDLAVAALQPQHLVQILACQGGAGGRSRRAQSPGGWCGGRGPHD